MQDAGAASGRLNITHRDGIDTDTPMGKVVLTRRAVALGLDARGAPLLQRRPQGHFHMRAEALDAWTVETRLERLAPDDEQSDEADRRNRRCVRAQIDPGSGRRDEGGRLGRVHDPPAL